MLLTHDPKSEILKKVWKNFPRNPLSDHPIFGKIFQDLAIWVKYVNFTKLDHLESILINVSAFLEKNYLTPKNAPKINDSARKS